VNELSVVGPDARADVLGISCLRGGGKADEVGEENGHDLAFFLDWRRRMLGQWGAAEGQNGNSPGSSLPQEGHVGTRAVYEGRPRIQTTDDVADGLT
jgi:hypothetical protein